MSSSMILSVVTFIYALSAVLYISAWIFESKVSERIALYSAMVGIVGNLAGFLLRWHESYGHGYGHSGYGPPGYRCR